VRRTVAVVILIIGVLAIVAGAIYLTQPAHALPSFFPGYAAHLAGKHPKRGYAGIAVGIVLVVVAFMAGVSGSRRRARR